MKSKYHAYLLRLGPSGCGMYQKAWASARSLQCAITCHGWFKNKNWTVIHLSADGVEEITMDNFYKIFKENRVTCTISGWGDK